MADQDLTSQEVTLLFLTPADSRRINLRFQDIRQPGAYSGGYLYDVGSGTSYKITPLIAEISDGIYQVKITTDANTEGLIGVNGRYVVLRWVYTGDETVDLVEITDVVTPAANDIVLAKITNVSGGYTFDYGDAEYPRTQPNTLDLHLKVEPPDADSSNKLKPRVRAGRIQTPAASIDIPDQAETAVVAASVGGNSLVNLVYVTAAGLIAVDSSGDEDTTGSEEAPDYAGKNVLAEITVPEGTTIITTAMIKDVRRIVDQGLLDEDDFASDSDKQGATQKSIKAYISEIAVAEAFTPNPMTGDNDSAGTLILPNGFRMEWGKETGVSGQSTVVTFTSSFFTKVFKLIPIMSTFGGSNLVNPTVTSLDNVNATVNHDNEENTGFDWIAIGR